MKFDDTKDYRCSNSLFIENSFQTSIPLYKYFIAVSRQKYQTLAIIL